MELLISFYKFKFQMPLNVCVTVHRPLMIHRQDKTCVMVIFVFADKLNVGFESINPLPWYICYAWAFLCSISMISLQPDDMNVPRYLIVVTCISINLSGWKDVYHQIYRFAKYGIQFFSHSDADPSSRWYLPIYLTSVWLRLRCMPSKQLHRRILCLLN